MVILIVVALVIMALSLAMVLSAVRDAKRSGLVSEQDLKIDQADPIAALDRAEQTRRIMRERFAGKVKP